MEKLTWFKFNVSDWVMGKIMKCPEITQARFLRLCCLYWNKQCSLSIEDAEIEIDNDHLQILIGKKIVMVDGDFIYIKFLDEQNTNVSETSQKRREAVQKRWERVKQASTIVIQDDTSVSKNDTSVLQSDTEKSREEKKREEERILKDSLDKRKLLFSQSLTRFVDVYGAKTVREFCDYWTEPNKSKTRFKQELEKTWDVDSRIRRWAANDFNKSKKQTEPQKSQFVH